jgi:hypothetical protein
MQYALLLYNDEAAGAKLSKDDMRKLVGAYQAFAEALKKAGAYSSSHGLSGSTAATTVRVANGKPQVLNGPYADSKEQLGGIFIIDVPDLDAALTWAARCPSAERGGVVEVRPMWGQ